MLKGRLDVDFDLNRQKNAMRFQKAKEKKVDNCLDDASVESSVTNIDDNSLSSTKSKSKLKLVPFENTKTEISFIHQHLKNWDYHL